jgi:membrane-bound serine protease (ClpP class)
MVRLPRFPRFHLFLLGSAVAALALLPLLARTAEASSPSPSAASTSPSAVLAPGPGVPPVVDIVKVDGVIDRPVADYLIATLQDAEARGDTVVVQLDTPGTLDVDPVALAARVFAARVPVVVWVGPAGSHAMGGGLLLLYASSLAATSPGSGVGPLEPLDLARTASAQDQALRERGLQTVVDQWAASRGRDPAFAFSGKEASAREALEQRVVRRAAISLGDLLRKIDGASVPVRGRAVTLRTDPNRAVLRFHELGPARRVLHAVASPVAIYVLIVLGLMGIAFELTQSGIGVAGIAGLAALGLAAYGLVVVPFDALGLALLLGGPALLSVDVALRRLGPITGVGMAAFLAGSELVFRQVATAIDLPVWLVVMASLGAFLYWGFALTVAQRARERITSTQRGLVGLVGEARGLLSPEGPVFVKGALWRGRATDGPIPPGTRVRVRGVEGLILRVEPEE